ncbi:MAG: hypothetical protein ABSH47_09600 [Bryobacteraceae bacterium]
MLLNIIRSAATGLLVAGLLLTGAFAQNGFDNSGNGTLVGDYYVREVSFTRVSTAGTVGLARSATGIVSFSPLGGYNFNGQIMDSSVQSRIPSPVTINGTFEVAANSFLQMQSLLGTTSDGPDLLRGGVGIVGPSAFVASATEGPNFDMIVGIPLATGLELDTLQGLYSFAYLDFVNAQASQVRNAWFTLNADGHGTAGYATPVTGSAANINNNTYSESSGAVAYTLSDANGGSLIFADAPNPEYRLISGTKVFSISPDGNLLLGGAVDGYDLLIGTRPVTEASNAGVLSFYHLAGLEENASQISQGTDVFDTFYGSSSTKPAGLAINHQRTSVLNTIPYDATFNITYTVSADGVFQPTGSPYRYMLGARNLVMLGSGTNGQYSLIVGLAQQYSRNSNVFLHPLGIVNAANYAPATNPIAPLEIVLLFGQNLSQASAIGTLPLPTTLGKTQVLINGEAAPLFSVSPTLLEVLVPLDVSPARGVSFATFQVVNNDIPSNSVTVYVRKTAPGVFSAGADGIGPVAALHADGSLVDAANPATSGETVELFVSGLGPVTPGVGDGAAGLPPPHASLADGKPVVYIDGIQSPNVPYAGLAPYFAGLYQVNAEIPAGTSSGDLSLRILTADGPTAETTISVQATPQ